MDLAASESEPEGAMMDETIVGRFLDACENASGVVAVHSSSSFGRAATCIGCYLMKHFHFSAREAIGWIRLCRPGSFSLAHQVFLGRMQQRMWTEGEEFKRIAGAYVMGTNPVNPPMDANVGNLSSRSLQINIGNISLEGDSLLGTREKKAASSNLPDTAVGANGSSSTGRPIASPAATNVARRRPFTQGSHRSHHRLSDSGHSGSLRGDLDFAAMHKFLHQSATPATATTVASGNIRSGRGGTLARPATTAPDLNIANKAECTF
ncbi:TPA: hypothetical protein N0F65_010352 [Lagenidium giganteum]|uniref:Tyrosine specific protein phosphatases domain-containing protein n=1 Tax=Lagenidium giganteum TaxID=4803 RepID=A0AAV2Z5R0_9STRA|nr:TPA: hypothetical protein N0F65_010352 [Lagenidium giganteum]